MKKVEVIGDYYVIEVTESSVSCWHSDEECREGSNSVILIRKQVRDNEYFPGRTEEWVVTKCVNVMCPGFPTGLEGIEEARFISKCIETSLKIAKLLRGSGFNYFCNKIKSQHKQLFEV